MVCDLEHHVGKLQTWAMFDVCNKNQWIPHDDPVACIGYVAYVFVCHFFLSHCEERDHGMCL